MTERPAFEITAGGKTYRVYASGKIDGFGEGAIVINRIPLLMREAAAQGTTMVSA